MLPQTAAAVVGAGLLLWALPEGVATWRKVIAVIFTVGFAHQVVTVLRAPLGAASVPFVTRFRLVFPAFGFVFFIAGVLTVPQSVGYGLLVAGACWRLILGQVFR